MLNGFAVGWSSNISADEDSSVSPDVSMHDYSSRNDPMSTIAPVTDIEYESDEGDESHILIWPNDTITPLLLLFRQNQTSWIISAFPFGVVIMSIILCKCYYYVGTKLSILSASLFIMVSWILIAFCGWVLLLSSASVYTLWIQSFRHRQTSQTTWWFWDFFVKISAYPPLKLHSCHFNANPIHVTCGFKQIVCQCYPLPLNLSFYLFF